MMVKTIFSDAWRIGRATALVLGTAVMLALVVGLASTAFGANGDAWRLGKGNVATKITGLAGPLGVNGPMVRLTNNNAGTDDTALELRVQPGEAPMTVNSATRVNNLNADQLDGQDSSQFVPANTNSFVRNSLYRNESALTAGTQLGDGTFTLAASCAAGDVMLSGGPANLSGTTDMVESFPSSTTTWTARVDKNGLTDSYSVVVLCANQ
jgi:hypothetical protein